MPDLYLQNNYFDETENIVDEQRLKYKEVVEKYLIDKTNT